VAALEPRIVRELAAATGREREVLTLIARGLTDPEIAARLGISISTVKTHVRRVLPRLLRAPWSCARGRFLPSRANPTMKSLSNNHGMARQLT